MADTIKVFGNNIPKPVAIGGGIVGLVAGVYFYRTKKQKSDAAASVATAGSNEIDPATGYPYGSPEDAAAMSSQDNYQLPTAGGGYGFTGYAGGSGSGLFGTGTPGSFNSNAEWAQYVESYEENNLGADAPTVGNAIGKYLTGQPLTTDQIGLVQSAIAIAGYPPVSGPNGNPPNYVTANTGTTTPPGNGGTPPPTPNPKDKTFRTTGGKSLSQIAKQLGVGAAAIASMTAAKDYNKGKAWPYLSNWNKPIPAGIILVYGVQ